MNSNWLLRTESVLGSQEVEKLRNSKVLIAGLGGVGGYALEGLARCGIGSFILVDSDVFEETNLNRQVLCTVANIGKLKTEEAKKRILSINPQAEITTCSIRLDKTDIDEFLNMKPDIVIDAIDSVDSKCFLLQRCYKRKIHVVSSMGAALRKDPTSIRISDISSTSRDPLAKAVRQNLRKVGITSGITCVCSVEKPVSLSDGTLGSLASVTGVFGLTLAQAAIDLLIQNSLEN